MKLYFLYWNTENKDSKEDVLEGILKTHSIDIIILGESKKGLSNGFCKVNDLIELVLLSGEREELRMRLYYKHKHDLAFRHLNNFSDSEEKEIIMHETIDTILIQRTIKRIARVVQLEMTINNEKYLLSCIHFPSKNNQDEVSQLQTAYNYKKYILEKNADYNQKVIIVGDFNMNPFDAGMIEPHGFYALNHQDLIRDNVTFQHSPETMLYNPCWWLMGDYHPKNSSIKVSGSHYFKSAPSKKLYWHLFDQVLISKNMIDHFNYDDLEVLEIEEILQELKSKKTREQAIYADHLPIMYSLNF